MAEITFYSNKYGGRQLRLVITQTQNIADNTSPLNWTLYSEGGSSAYYTIYPTTIKINDVQVYYKGTTAYNTHEFPAKKGSTSGTIVVTHNTDGTLTVPVYFKTAVYEPAYSKDRGGDFVLDSNPRWATIVSAPNFNDEENPKITYSNPAGNDITTLQACISLDGSAADIAYRDIPKTGTSYTFNLTEAERNVLRNATTTANSRTVKFFVRSAISGATQHSSLTKTLTIVNANPTINQSIVDTNSETVALTGDSGKLVRYFSNAQIAFGDAALKGATIVTRKVTCGNKTLYSDGTMNGVESGTFTFTVTDTRGNTTTKTVTIPFVEYAKLTCAIGNNMPDVSGNMTVTCSGVFFNGSFGAANNSLTVQYRYKTAGGTYGSWTNMTVTKNGNAYTASASLTGLNYQTTYVFQTRAVDSLMEVSSAERSVVATPNFEIRKNSFKFNVPVSGITADMVGARPSDWLPTPAQVGAAPDGYGIGEINSKLLTDPDEITNGGFYTIAASSVNVPFNYGTLIHIPRYGRKYAAQIAIASRGEIAFRTSNSGDTVVWGDWKHINPYMTIGKEYLTAEFWNGKPVYCKAVDCGTLPDAARKSITHGADSTNIIRCYGTLSNGENIPRWYDSYTTLIYASNLAIYITTSNTQSNRTCVAVIYYTKD